MWTSVHCLVGERGRVVGRNSIKCFFLTFFFSAFVLAFCSFRFLAGLLQMFRSKAHSRGGDIPPLDGRGWADEATRNAGYCPVCKYRARPSFPSPLSCQSCVHILSSRPNPVPKRPRRSSPLVSQWLSSMGMAKVMSNIHMFPSQILPKPHIRHTLTSTKMTVSRFYLEGIREVNLSIGVK